jgi:DNA-binding CsgD family transcriptional regulator
MVSEASKANLRPRGAKTPERGAELARDRKVAAAEMERSIEEMSANGLTPQQISLLTGLKPERLYKRYRDCMMKGGARRTNEVAQAAYLMSVGGPDKDWRRADAGMNKFWLERRGGDAWALPDKDGVGGPDLTRLTVPQLIELEKALRPLARNPVMIDAEVTSERVTDARGGGSGADAPRAGDQPDRGVGERSDGEGEVPG